MADLATPMSIRVAATLGLVELAGSEGATPMCFGGRERTVDELAADCGLVLRRSGPVADGRTAVEFGAGQPGQESRSPGQ